MTIIYNSTTCHRIISEVVRTKGGFRERDIWKNPHIISRAETWNAEHKVMNVCEVATGPDGYSNGFQVDLVTRRIVG